MAVIIALGNDKVFQLFPGLEGTDPGSLKRHDSKYSRICGYNLHQVSLQQAIASARIHLCAVAI